MCVHRGGDKQNIALLENESNNLCKPPTYDLKSILRSALDLEKYRYS